MRILILGADGMLGHQLVESLGPRHDLVGTLRQGPEQYPHLRQRPAETLYGVDVRDFAQVADALRRARPEAVINAVGIVKQRSESYDAIASLEVNSLLPHRLAVACAAQGARLVHLSTDCVFSGAGGMYRESDAPDARDLYGRSKLLGEVTQPGAITLRTSIIGLELSRRKSLVEWFLAQRGSIRGYRRAIYSGFSTLEMARIIEHVLLQRPELHGLYHVSSEPIDKYTLLTRLRDRLGRELEIVPDDEFHCDRSLESSRFREAAGYAPPAWDEMIEELAMQIEERYP
jgi:dTDP-4-dehydrorhamnose reductase